MNSYETACSTEIGLSLVSGLLLEKKRLEKTLSPLWVK